MSGLPPKVALRFRDLYGKQVPATVLSKAEEWLKAHNEFHRKAEDMELARALLYEQARQSGAASAPGVWGRSTYRPGRRLGP